MNAETWEEAAAWLVKARGDQLAAETLAAPEVAQRDIAIYHCQQAAEKAIKGLLVSSGTTGQARRFCSKCSMA